MEPKCSHARIDGSWYRGGMRPRHVPLLPPRPRALGTTPTPVPRLRSPGRLVLRYGPTDRPGLDPMAWRWRQGRREGPAGALLAALVALAAAAHACCARDHQCPHRVRSIIGAHAASLSWVYLVIVLREHADAMIQSICSLQAMNGNLLMCPNTAT
jgi:hypothetical protein